MQWGARRKCANPSVCFIGAHPRIIIQAQTWDRNTERLSKVSEGQVINKINETRARNALGFGLRLDIKLNIRKKRKNKTTHRAGEHNKVANQSHDRRIIRAFGTIEMLVRLEKPFTPDMHSVPGCDLELAPWDTAVTSLLHAMWKVYLMDIKELKDKCWHAKRYSRACIKIMNGPERDGTRERRSGAYLSAH